MQFGAPVTDAFTGDTEMWGLDFVWKWAPERQPGRAQLQAAGRVLPSQRERFADVRHRRTARRNRQLRLAIRTAGMRRSCISSCRAGASAPATTHLDSGSTDIGLVRSGAIAEQRDFPILADHDPRRTTTMVDFSPSEFSRLRLQYAWDQARFTDTDDELSLQYIMSLGAHGAHKF